MSIFLETSRLILKTPELSHFSDLLALRTDPDVMKYIGENGAIQTKEDVSLFLTLAMAYQTKHGFGFCSVFEKESDAFVGQAGLCHLALDDNQAEIELSYRLHKRYWGRGYATELSRALITWGFEHLVVDKFIAVTHADNIDSQKVLKKIGMIHIGKRDYRGTQVEGYEIYKKI